MMLETVEVPDGFILSDAAMYSFVCQDVFRDIISFAAAIPDHLKPLFLIPIKLEKATTASTVASRIARRRYADGILPTGDTPDADLFGTKTFVNDDSEPTLPSSDPGSIFRRDNAEGQTHHQECHEDQNIQVPTETSYNTDVDVSEYFEYPYRAPERVTHSSVRLARPILVRLALKPEIIEPHTPSKIQQNARACTVRLVSYDKRTRIFTFSVDCGNVPRTVQASLSEINEVALICDCPFWQWNGPEHNAKSNSYLLGQPYGTASPPDVRDPERQFWSCKHAYAVLRKLDTFVQEIVTENWDKSDDELLDEVDEEWDRLEGVAEVPLDEQDDEEIETEWDEEAEIEEEEVEKAEAPAAGAPVPEEDKEEIEEEVEEAEEAIEPEEEPVDYSGEPTGDDEEEAEEAEEESEPEEEAEEEPEEEPTDYSGEDEEDEEKDKK